MYTTAHRKSVLNNQFTQMLHNGLTCDDSCTSSILCHYTLSKSASLTAAGRCFTLLLGIVPTLSTAVFSDPSYT
jgi:hypothetical protein